jgi:hypothetical protein
MQKKRKHHDVWRAYLAAWAPNGTIFCLRDGKIFESGLMGVANRRDFYKPEPLSDREIAFIKQLAIESARPHLQKMNQGWLDTLTIPFKIAHLVQKTGLSDPDAIEDINAGIHNFVEDLHSRIESGAVQYLEALRNRDASFFLNDSDCIDFTHFLCVQYMRTARMQHVGMLAAPELQGLRFEPMWKILRHMYASNIAWVLFAERAHWRLVFLDNSLSARTFITGDQPIVNTYALSSPGKEPSDLEFYYPLSPQLALLVTRKPEAANSHSVALNSEQMDHYNKHITHNSYEQIYADSREILEQIHAGTLRASPPLPATPA